MKKKSIIISIILIILVSLLILLSPQKIDDEINISNNVVEVMDLYMNIAPYGEMSYGDQYVSKQVFEPLVYINDKFEFENVLVDKFKIDKDKITFTLKNNSFKILDSEIELTEEYIIEYLEKLIRLSEANLISNPGIQNINEVKLNNKEIEILFNSEKPYNILALAENIGYQGKEGKWYGTKAFIEYQNDGIRLFNQNESTLYINSSLLPGLQNDKRISNMILGKALADNTVKTEPILNNYYGFITWGESGIKKFDKTTRQAIFMALENSDIRKDITYKAKSIYDNTDLYEEISITNNLVDKKSDTSNMPSLKIGVVDLGSFKEIHTALENTFLKIGIPVIVETAELIDLLGGSEYDLIYVRLERGISPDFSPLLAADGFIGKLDYSNDYYEEVEQIKEAKSWEEMCSYLSKLDKELRADGVWLFLDRGYDILSTRK